jgi:D-alanyl-D-alanine carboxypeptidase
MRWLFFIFLCLSTTVQAKTLSYGKLDSIRRKYNIPELGYALVDAKGIKEMGLCGYHSSESRDTASLNDYFHLGSNTKAITGFIAAYLVEKKLLNWDTKFFDLFPEWKDSANTAYHDMTLQTLLSHRAHIRPFTEGEENAKAPKFTGSKSAQRNAFVQYLIKLEPVMPVGDASYAYSNAGYSAAALMLEKVSGKTWEALVEEVLHVKLGLRYSLGWPTGKNPWGHWIEKDKLVTLPPTIDYRLDYIEPAGDISMPLPDYAKFIRLQLEGLAGDDNVLTHDTYRFLHYGIKDYAIGWLNRVDDKGKMASMHEGSAGTFDVLTFIKDGQAYIVFANKGESNEALNEVARALK